MLGAILGDIFGAAYERQPIRTPDFDLFDEARYFTDDTVLTVATADAILADGDYAHSYREWGLRYPNRGYGGFFRKWLGNPDRAFRNSFGNGSAMRVSPIGWAFDSLDEVLSEAERSALPTHRHPDGVAGAQAVAAAVFLARTGSSKEDIRDFVSSRFGYRLDRTIDEARSKHSFNATCPGSVPEALVAFLDSSSFEHALRLAISLGGDADTQAAIAGAVAEAHYRDIPPELMAEARRVLDEPLLQVVNRFQESRAQTANPA